MPILGRPSVIPRDILARAALTRGEKLLASAQLVNGSWLFATLKALYLIPASPADPAKDSSNEPGQEELEAARWRREWTDVDRATVDPESRTLTIRWATGQGEERYELGESVNRTFTRTINERVTASVVTAREIALPGGFARVAVRRRPDGGLFSQVLLLGSVDPEDPGVARELDEAENEVRERCGLPALG